MSDFSDNALTKIKPVYLSLSGYFQVLGLPCMWNEKLKGLS